MPLVRGSGFLIRSEGPRVFHQYHVVTAGHVACPVQYPNVFGGRSPALRAIGERHISTGLICPAANNGPSTPLTFPLLFPQKRFLNIDVAILHLKNEDRTIEELSKLGISVLDADPEPVRCGEQLLFCGVSVSESSTNAADDNLQVEYHTFDGTSHSEVLTHDYGTVIAAQSEFVMDPTMCGGAVVRRSNGKCVGVIAARIGQQDVIEDLPIPEASTLLRKPFLDLASTPGLTDQSLRVAFVPVADFLPNLRQIEI